MRTDIRVYILESEHRKKIVKTLFHYPGRLWSSSWMEDVTKISHATVFRALRRLVDLGILRQQKVNRKDIVYTLVEQSHLSQEIKKIVSTNIYEKTARKAVQEFVKQVDKEGIASIILYGSTARGECTAESDIDVLVILKKHNKHLEKKIYEVEGEISYKRYKTISILIMDEKEVKKEKETQFLREVKKDMEVLYGKKPF